LPILWMKPEDRTIEKIHTYMTETLGKAKVTYMTDLEAKAET